MPDSLPTEINADLQKVYERNKIMAQQKKKHTLEDIKALPEGQRAELIDGQMFLLTPPDTDLQRISYTVARAISDYINRKNGRSEVFLSPFAVFLNKDEYNYVEPDISIICDREKINDKGCNGAPDWVIEITSSSAPQRDYGIKLFKYHTAGVREYWIINPQKKAVIVFDFEKQRFSNQYCWNDDIPVCIYKDLVINLEKLLSQKSHSRLTGR